MKLSRRHLRILLTAGACGLLFEFVAFSDFDGAWADDMSLIEQGTGAGGSGFMPPNILFVFDSSASMNRMACDDNDLPDWMECTASKRVALDAPYGSKVCANSVFANTLGIDRDGDGTFDTYQAPYEADGTTYNTATERYPIFDERNANANDDLFHTAGIYRVARNINETYDELRTGSGSTTEAQIADAINNECANISDCEQRSRCIYSLRTLGYYWEPNSDCAAGDPMFMCADCGNNTAAGAEVCDGTDLQGESCTSQGFLGGTLGCANDCRSFNTSNCFNCGNNAVDGGEVCDGTDLNSQTCATRSFDSGTLACNSDCLSFDTSACVSNEVCGNNTAEGSEECDGTDLRGQDCVDRSFDGGTLACDTCSFDTSSCTTGGAGGLGRACGDTADCTGTYECENNICSTCDKDQDCSGTCVRLPGCGHYMCDDQSCQVYTCSQFTAGTLGACCLQDSDCTSNKCHAGVCSECNVNADCSTNDCQTHSDCAYYICKNASCSVSAPAGGGGGGGGLGGGGSLGVVTGLAKASQGFGTDTIYVSYPIVLGDWLNFYPPKGIGLVGSFKRVINNLTGDARMGVLDFGDIGSQNVSFSIKPPCSQIDDNCLDGDPSTPCFNPSNANLINYLDSLSFGGDTLLAYSLDRAAAHYFESNGVDTPICDASDTCGDSPNNIVLITDGMPSGDADSGDDLEHIYAAITTKSDLDDGGYASNGTLMDEAAKAMLGIDFRSDLAGTQNVNTFVVSYGVVDSSDSSKCTGMLADTAAAGGGTCVTASNANELEYQLNQIISNIIERNMSFAAPSVSTTRVEATSVLSNASFRPRTNFTFFEGHVFGFQVCDENLGDGCSCPADDGDGEVCITDASDPPREVTYDTFGHLESTPYWDAQLCLSGDAYDCSGHTGTCVPNLGAIDEDLANLDVSGCYRTADETSTDPTPRKILTAVEHAGSANQLTGADQIAFTIGNLSGQTYSAAYIAALNVGGDLGKATKLVGFFRGLDTSDLDGDNNFTEDRNLNTMRDASGDLVSGWWKFGDIFHSIPNTVERPTGRGVGAWALTDSYLDFAEDNDERKKVIIAGANDGMLHAFNAGQWDGDLNDGAGGYDKGTGEELWGFVSPEILPRLIEACDPSTEPCNTSNHQYFVDGSVMVRDIWIGGSDDKSTASNKSKWKTVAIYGHRRGGKTVVALDITDVDNPSLLWVFPQPDSVDNNGDPVSNIVGQSWLDVFPAPASIGPLQVTDGTDEYDRWVVLLSGGFDAADSKGRALFMLDAWTGEIVWMVQKTGSGDTADMKYSFPATPVFYASSSGNVPYIAGIVAADRGGQIWHIPTPGPATASGGRYSFSPEVVFRSLATPIPTDLVGGNNDGDVDFAEYQSRPFFFAPTLTRHNGNVRVIIGSGDRDMLSPEDGINASIKTSICEDRQRLYAIDLATCINTDGDPRPCTEADLHEVTVDAGVWDGASPLDRGWYYQLEPGEKASTPYDILAGFAMYTTFRPTAACGDAQACGAAGEAWLHARHYVTGIPLDWNGDGAVAIGEERVSLGSGVPTAPAMSVAVADGTATPTVFAGGSDSGLQTVTAAGAKFDLLMQISRFPVSRNMCEALH